MALVTSPLLGIDKFTKYPTATAKKLSLKFPIEIILSNITQKYEKMLLINKITSPNIGNVNVRMIISPPKSNWLIIECFSEIDKNNLIKFLSEINIIIFIEDDYDIITRDFYNIENNLLEVIEIDCNIMPKDSFEIKIPKRRNLICSLFDYLFS